jgi:hypothetical protein
MDKKHCCKRMEDELNYKCPTCKNVSACPDNLVDYSAKRNAYGIIVHGKESEVVSYVEIGYCPWCGKKLPSKGEGRWLDI